VSADDVVTVQTPSTDAPTEAGGALEGIRAIELGQLLAGPFAGHLLADLGAEVIKVEPPGKGDPMREWGHEKYKGRALFWPSLARNKKSVSLNLRSPEGQALLLELVADADVLIENFRPGTLEKWGIGPDTLLEKNPQLVIARVSGYGQTGPYADRVGFASAGEAVGGLRHLNGFPDQAPPRTGVSLGDSLAGMFAVQGILAALVWRLGPGPRSGQVIDATITESCFALLEGAITEYNALGVIRGPSGTGLRNVAPSNIYRSREGKWIVIAANADPIFGRLCAAMDAPDLAADPRFVSHTARGDNAEELDRLIGEWTAELDAEVIESILNDAGVVVSRIYDAADISRDPQFLARDMLLRVEDPELGEIVLPGFVPKLSVTPGSVKWTGPGTVGAHNEEIYCDLLGHSREDLESWRQSGIV